MPDVLDNEEEIRRIKSWINDLPKDRKTDKIQNTQGFYGYLEGLEKPPKTKPGSQNAEDLRKLLEGIKSIKPFFKDKEPKLTPLVNYFYARYMAAWLRATEVPQKALNVTRDVTVSGKGSPRERYEKFCDLIETAYSIDNATLERIFPFDRVKTVGDKVGMLQKQYSVLRNEERKKFRTSSVKIKVPPRESKTKSKPAKYGNTVAYYIEKYIKDETKLTLNTRGMPQVLKKGSDDVAFLEVGATITGDGEDIRRAESPEYAAFEAWWFGGKVEADNASDEERAVLDKEIFDLMYLPTPSDAEGISHYLLDPDGERISVYLEDEGVFATKENDFDPPLDFKLTASGETFIPPNPKDNKSFAALGDVVESLMAHIATVANDSIYPGNEYDEIHNGLLGAKNLPGIAVYHANVFYHLLLAQARDPIANWREIDENLLAEGKIIGIEAYLVNPLQTLVLWMLRNRNYIDFAGIDRNTNSPRIKSPERLSVAESMVDERAKAEMTNSLSKLIIAYYRSMYSMLRGKPYLFPKFEGDNKTKEYDLKKKAKWDEKKQEWKDTQDGMDVGRTDWIDLSKLWDDLIVDVQEAEIDPVIIASIVDYMFANGSGRIVFPATMDTTSAERSKGWDKKAIERWLSFTFSAKPTDIGAFVECASAVSAAIRMTEYNAAETHHKGINRFLGGVGLENGYSFLIALLSIPESDALEEVRESLELKEGMTYMPKRNPKRTPKEPKEDEEYYVSINLDMPVEISLEDEFEVMALLDRIEDKLGDADIDEPSDIGTDGKTIDMGWYIKGLKNASEVLTKATEVYSALGIPGRGWLEWGKEGLSKKYTVDGYSFEDL